MKFCNLDFKLLKKDDLFTRDEGELKVIIPTNAQLIGIANENKRFYDFLNRNNCCFDGQIPLNYARRINKQDIDKMSGSDIVYDFCSYAKEKKLKIFFLGGKQTSNIKSVETIQNKYEVEIAGFSPDYEPYPFSEHFINQCLNKIADFKPDILFVGFGAPKQEFYIEDNFVEFKKMNIKYIICCGGTFEFISGEIKRAPKWISKIGLESIYRLIKEFNIMRIKRILVSFKFKKYIKKQPNFNN